MARTPSNMLELGTRLPPFRLPECDGQTIEVNSSTKSRAFMVMFICNHCPFVQHLRPKLAELTKKWLKQEVAVFAINSNDVKSHPDDSPAKMSEEKQKQGYVFPYLFDETQGVAKAFKAACTPDFYLFDEAQRLVYRGQFDDSRPGNGKLVTGADLDGAIQSMLRGAAISPDQKPSIGCNIKWKT